MKNFKILTIVWGIDERNLYTALLSERGKIKKEFHKSIKDPKGLSKLIRFILANEIDFVLIENPYNLKNIRRKIFGKRATENRKWKKKFELIQLCFYALQQNLLEYNVRFKIINSTLRHYNPILLTSLG